MKHVYTLRDRLSGTFLLPIFDASVPEDFARGQVFFCMHNPVKAYDQHLECMELVYLGTYDETKASFSLIEKPEILVDLGPVCEQAKARINNA